MPGEDLHWLKIDVEGFERDALAGWSARSPRPWIVVVESTAPLTQQDVSAAWEPLALARGYEFAYFDGLNRFYVATERRLRQGVRGAAELLRQLLGVDAFGLCASSAEELVTQSALARRLEAAEHELRTALATAESRFGAEAARVAALESLLRETELARSAASARRRQPSASGTRTCARRYFRTSAPSATGWQASKSRCSATR